MKIVADENIPLVRPFFSDFGEVFLTRGREISKDMVKNCDMVLVRSVTPVGMQLLEGSTVRFVGTATTGVDHIDVEGLQQAGIGFAHAGGCNSNSVSEYVLSALLLLAEHYRFSLQDKTAGIIGYGRIGRRVKNQLEGLGTDCTVYDPWLKDQGVSGLSTLDEVLGADIVTLHPSLTDRAPYPSVHLLNQNRLKRLKAGTILINTSRGVVVDNRALADRLKERRDLIVVLDVWENEPDISADLLGRVAIGTPHISGYSLDGKGKGTEMNYEAACRFFGLPSRKRLMDLIPNPPLKKLSFDPEAPTEWAVRTAIRSCYDVFRDDRDLRLTLGFKENERASAFDRLRKNYPERREFFNVTVDFQGRSHPSLKLFKQLGFRV